MTIDWKKESMKKAGVLILIFIASTAFAFDYSISSDTVRKKFLNQYEKDRNSLNKQEVFLVPKVKPNWPCPISKEEQYRLVNLLQNDFLDQKITQKSSHNLKKTSDTQNSKKISNVQIIPLKVQCMNGKILGDIELRTEYDIELNQSINGLSHKTNIRSKIHKITLSRGTIKDGSLSGISKTFIQYKTSNFKDSEEPVNNAFITLELNYKDSLGNKALFIQDKKLNGVDYNLRSAFISTIDKYHTRKITYINNQISSIEFFKDGIPDGDQLGYIIGNQEKMSLIQNAFPAMHPKLVKINGKDFIETHLCMQNGVEVDRFPCDISN